MQILLNMHINFTECKTSELVPGDIKHFLCVVSWLANCVHSITNSCHEQMCLKRICFRRDPSANHQALGLTGMEKCLQ